MIELISLIAIWIVNVQFVEKTNAAGGHKEGQLCGGSSSGQKVQLKREENYPIVFYYRGCLPTEIPLYTNVPCTPENPEEFTKYGVDPNVHHEKCPKWRGGITPTCRYAYSGFVCCVPVEPNYRIDETLMLNKKAAYIMADILLKTTLFLDFGEVANTSQYLEAFEQFREFVVKKINLDKISLPIHTLHSFFKFLSTENDGKMVNEEESDMHNKIGFNKLLGTYMEREMNKFCADYEKADAQHSHEYNEICKKVAKFIQLQFHNAENVWQMHKTKLEANLQTKNFYKNYIKKLIKAYNKDGNPSYSYQIPNKDKFDLEDVRKIVAYGEARNIYRQIWIKALNYALMSIGQFVCGDISTKDKGRCKNGHLHNGVNKDVCSFPPRIKFWDKKLKKAIQLGEYREGKTNAEYLIYFLLKIIKQINAKFNKFSEDDPYKAIEKDDVEIIDANLPKNCKWRERGIKGIKILVIAPNRFGSHFALFKTIVRILLAQEWIHKIKLFIPESTSIDRQRTNLTTGGKLVVEFFNPYEIGGGEPRIPVKFKNNWEPWDYQNAKYYYSGSDTKIFLDLANETELIKALKAENFDIGIAELWDHGAFPILWLLGIKNIFAIENKPQLEAIHYEFLGYLSAIIKQGDIPEWWTTKIDDHKVENSPDFANSLQERADYLYNVYNVTLMQPFGEIVKNHYDTKQVPSFKELFNGIRNIFLNTQPFLNFPMPTGYPSKVVHIGGIQMSNSSEYETKSLDEMELRAIEASSRGQKGLILISFGTVISMKDIPKTTFEYFLQVFEKYHDYEFLWKFDSEEELLLKLLQKFDNVHLKKWLNIFEILGNAQTKLFISHCGINSIIESVHHAVPILCIPIIADQFYLAEALAKQNVAVVANKDDLSNFSDKIGVALEDGYRQNIQHLKMKMNAVRPEEEFLEKIRELF